MCLHVNSRQFSFFVLFVFLVLFDVTPKVYAAVSTDSLVGYWKFDEGTGGSGATTVDSSGHGNTGTLYSAPAWSATVPTLSYTNPYVLDFDGVDDYVETPVITLAGSASFSFWMKATTYSRRILGSRDGSNNGFDFYHGSAGLMGFYNVTSGGNDTSAGAVPDYTNWYHYVWVIKDGVGMELFRDGASIYSNTNANSTVTQSTDTTHIGRYRPSAIQHFKGQLDDVRIYNTALSADAVAQLAGGNHLTAIWDGTSSTNFDVSANWNTNAVPDLYTDIIVNNTGSGSPIAASTISGSSLTIEANASLDLHGFDLEFVDSGTLKGGGTLKLLGSETITNLSNVATTSTGTVLYYGTGSYAGLTAGDSYNNLTINDGLVGYWKLDDGSGLSAVDSSGYGNDGTLTNGPTWSSTVPSLSYTNPYSLSFDGVDDALVIGDHEDHEIENDVTYSAWIKTSTSVFKIIAMRRGVSGNIWVYLSVLATDLIRFSVSTTPSARVDAESTTNVNDDAWHYIVGVMRGDTASIYVDGRLEHSDTDISLTARSFGNQAGEILTIGNGTSNYNNASLIYPFDGLIDDVRIYNRALSPTEISSLASGFHPATASGTFILDAALTVSGSLTLAAGTLDVSASNYAITSSGSWLNYGGVFTARSGTVTLEDASGSDTIASGGQKFNNLTINGAATYTLAERLTATGTLSLNAGTLDVSANNYAVHAGAYTDTGGGTFTARSGNLTLTSASDVAFSASNTLNELTIEDPTENGLIGYWKFDECQGTTAYDVSGNGNNGTLTNGPTWSGATLTTLAYDNVCELSFDGVDDYVDAENNSVLKLTNNIGLCLWIRANSFSAYKHIFHSASPAATYGYGLQLDSSTPSLVGFRVNNYANLLAKTSSLSTNTWYNICSTYDTSLPSANVKMYVNGSLVNTADSAASISYVGTLYSYIGSTILFSSLRTFDGLIDDVRIYNRALTASEVSNLANGYYADGANSTATYTLGTNLDVSTLNILSGKLSAGSQTIDVSSDFNNYAGTGSFVAGTSTVDLDGASTQNIRGSTNFYNLEASTTTAQTINFGSGTTQGVSNSLTFTGLASNLLTLAPLSAAYTWFLNVASAVTQTISYVTMSYSDASSNATINAYDGTNINGGDTLNWLFVAPSTGGAAARQRRASNPSQGGGGEVVYNDTDAPTLAAIGIADDVTETVAANVGGIYDPSMRKQETVELSRRVLEVARALAERFTKGIQEFRIAQKQSAETLQGSAPDDIERRMMRAERNIADYSLTALTASAIGEKRGLLVAMVKSEEVVYSDVPTDAWFTPFISSVIADDIATGYEDKDGNPTGEFGVIKPVTYAEMLKMALQASKNTPSLSAIPQNNSARGTWAAPYIALGEDLALSVFTDGRNVHQPATRGEVIHTMLQVMGVPTQANIELIKSLYTDLSADHPYVQAISTATIFGIITGDTDINGESLKTVRPDDTINRAEIAKMIALLKELLQ